METHTREFKASLLDYRIDVLDRNADRETATQRVYSTVSAILTLVRVSTLVLHPSVDSH